MSNIATIDDIKAAVDRNLAMDYDIDSYAAKSTMEVLDELFEACGVRSELDGTDYTQALVEEYVSFALCSEYSLGGSVGDYCSAAVLTGFLDVGGVTLEVVEDSILDVLVDRINSEALYPEREIERLQEAGVL